MKQRQLQLTAVRLPPANQRRPPSEGRRYHRWLFCGERNSGASCRRNSQMSGSQIEPPWQPRPRAQRFASLRAALVLPVAFQRRTVVPTAGGIGHPMAFAGLWDGRRRSDGAVARREDGLRSRDRPLATDRDANALGGPDDPPCGWLRRKVDRGRESSQRRMVHYRWPGRSRRHGVYFGAGMACTCRSKGRP